MRSRASSARPWRSVSSPWQARQRAAAATKASSAAPPSSRCAGSASDGAMSKHAAEQQGLEHRSRRWRCPWRRRARAASARPSSRSMPPDEGRSGLRRRLGEGGRELRRAAARSSERSSAARRPRDLEQDARPHLQQLGRSRVRCSGVRRRPTSRLGGTSAKMSSPRARGLAEEGRAGSAAASSPRPTPPAATSDWTSRRQASSAPAVNQPASARALADQRLGRGARRRRARPCRPRSASQEFLRSRPRSRQSAAVDAQSRGGRAPRGIAPPAPIAGPAPGP